MKSSVREMWSVGEVAKRFDLATHVLRHWEDVGLLLPERDGAGRRRYGQDDVVKVAVIIRSKAAGMSLEQIAVMLDDSSHNRHQVLEAHIADLDRRMAEMARSREMTLHALECRAHDIALCPGFKRIVQDLVDGTGAWPVDPHSPDHAARHSSHGSSQGGHAVVG